jgi:hypothetical protein
VHNTQYLHLIRLFGAVICALFAQYYRTNVVLYAGWLKLMAQGDEGWNIPTTSGSRSPEGWAKRS